MTRRQLARRYLFALLIAGLMAAGIHRLNAQDEAAIIVKRPDICDYLEPWTWWWGALGCEAGYTAAAQRRTRR